MFNVFHENPDPSNDCPLRPLRRVPRVDSPEVAYEKKAWFVVNPQRSNWALRGHESTEIWSEKGVILVD